MGEYNLTLFYRPAIVFVHGDLSWDKLHLMISRSTTPDLVKMAAKLEEFFYQQFHSSKRVLSAFGPIPGGNRKSRSSKNSCDEGKSIKESSCEILVTVIFHCKT